MINRCPYCKQGLNFSETQLAKAEEALAKLAPGKLLKMSCPHCQKIIELTTNGSVAAQKEDGKKKEAVQLKKTKVAPPEKPGLEWLASGRFDHKEVIKDIPMVLLLMDKGPAQTKVIEAFSDIEYKPVFPDTVEDAIGRMQFTNFASVVLHSRLEGANLEGSIFHGHMRNLAMERRRSIFYVLIGPEFNTLYNLEAFSHSANLVVNDKDVDNISLILKKAIPEYEMLFEPYVNALVSQGNKAGNLWLDIRRRAHPRIQSNVLKDLLEVVA